MPGPYLDPDPVKARQYILSRIRKEKENGKDITEEEKYLPKGYERAEFEFPREFEPEFPDDTDDEQDPEEGEDPNDED